LEPHNLSNGSRLRRRNYHDIVIFVRPDWEAFTKAFREEIGPHYSFVWNRLSDQERTNLGQLARGQAVPHQQAHLNEGMNMRGLLALNEGPARVESTAFRDFILKQTTQAGGSLLARFMKRKR